MKVLVVAALTCLASTALAAETSARIVVQHAPLAGFVYYEGDAVWNDIRSGDRLTLAREPTNTHDANAVRIEWQGRMLGYVPRKDNADLARQMDHGANVEARVTALEKFANGRRRISYLVYVPLK